jgi:hypothetical protein
MRIGVDVPIAQLLDEYDARSERYRALVASLDLDTPARKPLRGGETVTLRWILFHLIEETARHNGHLDILRELADGVDETAMQARTSTSMGCVQLASSARCRAPWRTRSGSAGGSGPSHHLLVCCARAKFFTTSAIALT